MAEVPARERAKSPRSCLTDSLTASLPVLPVLPGCAGCAAAAGMPACPAGVVGLWAVFVVVLGVELRAGWCGDGVAAGCVGLFFDGPSVGVDGGVVLFAE